MASINKAFTSRAFNISTKELAENSQPGDQFFGIHASNHDRVMIFAGGIPLKDKTGTVIGAIGGAYNQSSGLMGMLQPQLTDGLGNIASGFASFVSWAAITASTEALDLHIKTAKLKSKSLIDNSRDKKTRNG